MVNTNQLHISGRGVYKDPLLSGSSTPTSKPRYACSLPVHTTVALRERTCKT